MFSPLTQLEAPVASGDNDAATPGWSVEFKNVSKSFGSHPVLIDLDLQVRQGEKVTLIGPSGSGKTTVLRLAMALERPTSGDIRIFGKSTLLDGSGRPLSRAHQAGVLRRCGMVFQQFNLFPHLTVRENLVLAPITVLGHTRAQAEKDAKEYLNKVGLGHKEHSYPAQLSGGQQQRIAIARALILRPEILLLDEITSALDPELAGEVLDVVRHIAHELKVTLMIVTHEMGFAKEISDRVIVLEAGKILEQGTAEQIFSNPNHERTRGFLQSVLHR
ncbi:polar amino acid transport system ATP-binding protein [Bradyrhizobium sp. USDA 4451]